MKHLPGLTCAVFAVIVSIACGGVDKAAAPAANATSPANAASPGAPSGSPSAMSSPPATVQAAAQPLQDLFSARAVWPVRADDPTWKQVCGVSIGQVREGDPCVYIVMQRSGASPEAIDFLRRYGYFLE